MHVVENDAEIVVESKRLIDILSKEFDVCKIWKDCLIWFRNLLRRQSLGILDRLSSFRMWSERGVVFIQVPDEPAQSDDENWQSINWDWTCQE